MGDRISDAKRRLDAISRTYAKSGDAAQWEKDALTEIEALHTQLWLFGKGGFKNVSKRDLNSLSKIIEEQQEFLRNFRKDLTGEELSELRARNRLRIYAESALASYFKGQDATMKESDYQFEQWFLGNAEHCPGCIIQAEKGKVTIGTLPAIGSQQCLWNCQCEKRYFKE